MFGEWFARVPFPLILLIRGLGTLRRLRLYVCDADDRTGLVDRRFVQRPQHRRIASGAPMSAPRVGRHLTGPLREQPDSGPAGTLLVSSPALPRVLLSTAALLRRGWLRHDRYGGVERRRLHVYVQIVLLGRLLLGSVRLWVHVLQRGLVVRRHAVDRRCTDFLTAVRSSVDGTGHRIRTRSHWCRVAAGLTLVDTSWHA